VSHLLDVDRGSLVLDFRQRLTVFPSNVVGNAIKRVYVFGVMTKWLTRVMRSMVEELTYRPQ